MPISTVTGEIILEDVIKKILDEGLPLDFSLIEERYNQIVQGVDLSLPQFNLDNAKVTPLEISSASKWNTTNNQLSQDLHVVYRDLFEITNRSIDVFDRWRTETVILESKLKSLDIRISDLLRNLTQSDVKYISDDFVDTSSIDLLSTTASIDLHGETVGMSLSNNLPTKINLNAMSPKDCQFSILTRSNLLSSSIATHGELLNAFDDTNSFWQTRVSVTNPTQPITGELKMKFSETFISKISINLHATNSNTGIQITPFLSEDGVNYTQVDTSNLTVNTKDKASWVFPRTQVSYIKLLMTKQGYDYIDKGLYIYEFGAEDISLYDESYGTTEQVLISSLLSVPDLDNNPLEFSDVQLQVCERVPEDTSIQYYVAALATPSSDIHWVAIDHIAKLNSTHPKVIHFGNQLAIEVDDIFVSYNPVASLTWQVNPNVDFTLKDYTSIDAGVTTSITSDDVRYYLINSEDRILDTQILGDIIDTSYVVFRNVGKQNTSTSDYIDEVRHIRAGWKFEEPYYITTVEVSNTNGQQISFGDKALILDDLSVKGKIIIPYGTHTIKIHKNNWVNVPGGLTSLALLKVADPLFPFNHKHLIEGYGLIDSANPYVGVELFAEVEMKRISISDFITSVKPDDYTKYTIDIDNGAVVDGTPSTIFMVKSDKNKSDFLDERFTIRFKLNKQLYKYLKFKAVLFTDNPLVSPNLDGYKLRISKS